MKVIENKLCFVYYYKSDWETGVYDKLALTVPLEQLEEYLLKQISPAKNTTSKRAFVKDIKAAKNISDVIKRMIIAYDNAAQAEFVEY